MSDHDGMRDDDYLWYRSGPVDIEVARLERLLRGHALGDLPRRAGAQGQPQENPFGHGNKGARNAAAA